MKYLIGMLAKIYMLVLFVFIMEILLQMVTLEIILDQEIELAERVGYFDEIRMNSQLEKYKTIQSHDVVKIEVSPHFSEYVKSLGDPMSIAILYKLKSPITNVKQWVIRVERKGVNTGFYGDGYEK